MRRQIIILGGIAACAVVDFILPDVSVSDTQVMIAPAIIAAIIGAVGSLIGGAMGGKPKNEGIALQKGSFSPTEGSAADKFALGPDASRSKGPQALGQLASLGGGNSMAELFNQPPSLDMPKYNMAVQKSDEPISVTGGIQPPGPSDFTPLTGGPPKDNRGAGDTFKLSGTTPTGTQGALGTTDLSGGSSVTKGKGMDMDKTLQYAAMAATLGSLLNSGGPPRPPALPGGGRFDAQPTSMRFLYGG